MIGKILRCLSTAMICLTGGLALYLLVGLMAHEGDRRLVGPLPRQKAKEVEQTIPVPGLKKLLNSNADYDWAYRVNGSDRCAPYPHFDDILYSGEHFQYTKVNDISYYLLRAFYDRRHQVNQVRILAMVGIIKSDYPEAFCQVWYEGNSKPQILPVTHNEVVWYKEWGTKRGFVYPTLISCPLPEGQWHERVPQLVSLVFHDACAKPSNALMVFYSAPPRSRSLRCAVCVKFLQFPTVDMSQRFVEWLELLRLLGAERVVAYDIGELHPNTSRTLSHYLSQEPDFFHYHPFDMLDVHVDGEESVGLRDRLNEVLLYNDCLYRNMYEFDYVGVFDVDEVIMPLGNYLNWTMLLKRLEGDEVECSARVGYCFRNIYFPHQLPPDSSLPQQFYMLSHVQRLAQHLDANSAIKCLHSTAHVIGVHNHFALSWEQACNPFDVPVSMGQMQHYRQVNEFEKMLDPPPVRDDNILRFKDQLMGNALAVHRQLGWTGNLSGHAFVRGSRGPGDRGY